MIFWTDPFLRTLRYIISIILLLAISQTTFAQEQDGPAIEEGAETDVELDEKEKKEKKEKIPRDFKPSAVKVGLETIGLGRTVTSSGFTQFEGQADIDFDRYFFVLDLGHEKNSIANNEFNYTNNGNYIRAGVQINMMPYNQDKSFFFFGFRYARSLFSDQIAYTEDFDKWGQRNIEYKNPNLTATWYEVNMGMKVKVFERLYFGYTVRYKLNKSIKGFDSLMPRNIPGFGRADKSSNAGFNYYILYNIPFRDKPVPPKPKREHRERNSSSEQSQPTDFFQRSF